MRHIVFYSSGIGSWAAAKRVAEKHGTENLILMFADTLIEDDDNYRFLKESATNIGGKLVRVVDGRTPYEVFKDRKYIGNSRFAQCSEELKQKPCCKWLKTNGELTDQLYVGIGWDEMHRLPAIVRNWKPWEVFAPMTEAPYLDKIQILNWALSEGLTPPRSYQMGFPHANCLKRGCVRGGHAYWRHLLKVLPKSFASAEKEEIELRRHLGKDVSHLSHTIDGVKTPYTLQQLREEVESDDQIDLFDWGGCGCFVDDN